METKYPRLVEHQQHALAAIRIFLGLWFLWAVSGKLSAHWVGDFAKLMTSLAASTPIHAYGEFLSSVVVPGAQGFAFMVILGELAAGICLTLGLFTAPAALIGATLNLNFLLATAGAGQAAVGLNLTFLVVEIALAFSYAGTTWGLDRHVIGKLPWWFQGLLHYEYREF